MLFSLFLFTFFVNFILPCSGAPAPLATTISTQSRTTRTSAQVLYTATSVITKTSGTAYSPITQTAYNTADGVKTVFIIVPSSTLKATLSTSSSTTKRTQTLFTTTRTMLAGITCDQYTTMTLTGGSDILTYTEVHGCIVVGHVVPSSEPTTTPLTTSSSSTIRGNTLLTATPTTCTTVIGFIRGSETTYFTGVEGCVPAATSTSTSITTTTPIPTTCTTVIGYIFGSASTYFTGVEGCVPAATSTTSPPATITNKTLFTTTRTIQGVTCGQFTTQTLTGGSEIFGSEIFDYNDILTCKLPESTATTKLKTSTSSSLKSSSKTSSTLSSSKSVTVAVSQQTPLTEADVSILQLALFLEYLEGTLYAKGIQRYSEQDFESAGFARPMRDNVALIAQQEATHAKVIRETLINGGIAPFPNCTFRFNFTSPRNFIALGNMVSTAGVGAYLAGGAILKDNVFLLSVASSILTTEARHDAYIRGNIGAIPYPTSFDTVLPASLAYNLAQAFVVSCPQKLNYPIYPTLSLKSPLPKDNLQPALKAGTNLTFSYDATVVKSTDVKYVALLNSVTNVTYVGVTGCGVGCASILLPSGLGGVAFAVLTNLFGSDLNTLTASGVVAGPCEVLIS